MAKFSTSILVLVACLFLTEAFLLTDAKPGVAVRLNKPALDYVAKEVLDTAANWIVNNHNESVTGSISFINYNVSNIEIRGLKSMKTSVKISPDNKVNWEISNINFNLTASLTIKFKSWKLLGEGFGLSVNKLSLNLPLTLGENEEGAPSLQSTCTIENAGNWSLCYNGKLAWILTPKIKSIIIAEIQRKFCSSISASLNQGAAKAFSRYQGIVDIGSSFAANYSVQASPTFNNVSLTYPLNGNIFWKQGEATSPVVVPDLPPLSDVNQMVYFVLTDYVFNSLAFSAFHFEQLDKMVTSKDLPADQSFFLNTTCPGKLCLGKLIAQTASLYPNGVAEVQIKSSERPQMVISSNQVTVSLAANMLFYVNLPGKTGVYMFAVKTRLNTAVGIATDKVTSDRRLTASIISSSLSVGLLDSAIGSINLNLLNTLVDTIVNIYAIPELNRLGATGIPLPDFGSRVEYINPKLELLQNAVSLGVNLNFVKSHPKEIFFHPNIKMTEKSFHVVYANNDRKPVKL